MRLALPILALLCSCSWTAFDKFKDDPPVFAISNRAFGARVAITTDPDGNAIVGSGGLAPDGARFYALGQGTSDPTGAPLTNSAQCEIVADKISAGGACLAATTLSPAGVLQELDPKTGVLKQVHPGCFAVGYGKRSDSDVDPGPVVYCTDGGLYTMKPAGDSALAKAFAERNEQGIRSQRVAMATTLHDGKSINPGLVVASNVDERAWVYPTIRSQTDPIEITEAAGTAGDKYGSAVAYARSKKNGPTYLVSAPGIGTVYAWTVDAMKAEGRRVACIKGKQGMGETLVTADFDGDGEDDIFVNDDGGVKMFLGSQRPAAPASPADPCPEWPAARITLACEETMGATGCATSNFGASIAVGDFDMDGKKDVAVGAPFATTDGKTTGAVYLYTPSLDAPSKVVDVRYLNQMKANSAFGTSVASGLVGKQDTLVVGAAGNSVTYVVWCTGLPGTPGSPRCRK